MFTLYNGVRYEEMTNSKDYYRTRPHNIIRFAKQEMAFDLSQLDMKNTEKELYKGHYKFMNVKELSDEIDSITLDYNNRLITYSGYIKPYISLYSNSLEEKDSVSYLSETFIPNNFNKNNRETLLNSASGSIRNLKSMIEVNRNSLKELQNEKLKFRVELHNKFTLSTVILVLFFLAAPLGTIIRKGGLGLPMVISILMFIFYYVVDMVGDKIAREGIVPVWIGAWLATFVLLPFAIWIYRKASQDSPLFEGGFFRKLLQRFRKPQVAA